MASARSVDEDSGLCIETYEFAPHALRGCRWFILSRRKPKRLPRRKGAFAVVSSGVRIVYSYLETNFDTRKINIKCERGLGYWSVEEVVEVLEYGESSCCGGGGGECGRVKARMVRWSVVSSRV